MGIATIIAIGAAPEGAMGGPMMRLAGRIVRSAIVILLPVGVAAASPPSGGTDLGWTNLEPGLDLGRFRSSVPVEHGDGIVTILRVDPNHFDFRLLNASASADGKTRTAKEWCIGSGAIAAINSSMYQTDHRTSVSLMRTGDHVNNSRLSKDNAVLAFDPTADSLPPVRIIDRTCDDFDSLRSSYGTLVQSIRMVSCRQKNVWAQQPEKWSTAAIGIDRAGRVLFIHCRSPHSVHDFIDQLLEFPIDLYNAMYVEGGPEAQLYFRAGNRTESHIGSFESGFWENDDNKHAWPIPNVVAVMRIADRKPEEP
jgi:hypothetical protein